MPTFKQKNVIKSYKNILQKKLNTVTKETENATNFLNNCVAEFRNRVEYILGIKDEKCLSLYRKLSQDLENYSEKLFILQESLKDGSEEESDSTEDESSVCTSKDKQQLTSSSLSSADENTSPDQIEKNTDCQISTEQNANHQTFLKEISNSSENVNLTDSHKERPDVKASSNLVSSVEDLCRYFDENLKFSSSNPIVVEDDGGSITEDDFYSLHSDNNMLNINNVPGDTPFQMHDNQSISASDYASNDCMLASQNSCYLSISSTISESFLFPKDYKSFHSLKAYSLDADRGCTAETSLVTLKVPDLEFEISNRFSATLSHITDPSDFWIQMENSHGFELRFSKNDHEHLRSLPFIQKGAWCLAPFKSTPFYFRAKSFSDAKAGTDLVQVLFIDHGSHQSIPLCELRPMPKSAYDIPAQAINCYLYGIASTNDYWSPESIERFKEFQNYCIETVVKSRESTYGVQLIAKLSVDSFMEDFSVDLAQALCSDGLAISLNESPSETDTENNHHDSQFSKSQCKTDLSLEVSGSYDINAISNDSGVSVTSAYKSSQISKRNEIISEISTESISPVPSKDTPLLYDNNLNNLNNDFKMQNLISFDSYDAVNESHTFTEEVNTVSKQSSHYCLLCKCNSAGFCLHLKVSSPTLLFVKEDLVVVMISHIVNPHEFFVNMAMENIDALDDLRDQMTNIYENAKDIPWVKITKLEENMYCAGKYDADNYWYRVKVLKISPEDRERNEVLVQYIDYGNTAKIKCSNLRPLSREFANHPCFAIKCSLAGIRPVEDTSLSENPYWSEHSIQVFKELTSYERCLTAQICHELSKDDLYFVLLWDTEDNSEDILINVALADYKVAIFDSRLLQPLCSHNKVVKASIDNWDPMLEEYVDSHNSYAYDDEDIEVATTGYHAKDERYTCNYFALRGYCPRGSNCPYEHLPMLESGLTRDQEEVYCLDNTPIAENVNNVLIQVSSIITPLHFYAILPFGCKNVDDLNQLVLRGTSYDKIINAEARALFYAIDKYYANLPFQENTTIALSCGTIVAAKRKWDEKWYRGRVVDVVDINKPAKIFFVDSGDNEWVPRKFIRTIAPQFLHTPFQAVQCSLHGIKPAESENGSSWSSEALTHFKEVVRGEILLAEIVQRFGPVYHISLKKTVRPEGKTIAEHLVKAGHAQFLEVAEKRKSKAKAALYVPG